MWLASHFSEPLIAMLISNVKHSLRWVKILKSASSSSPVFVCLDINNATADIIPLQGAGLTRVS